MSNFPDLVYVSVTEVDVLVLVVQQTHVSSVLSTDLTVFPGFFEVVEVSNAKATRSLDQITELTDLILMCPLGCF